MMIKIECCSAMNYFLETQRLGLREFTRDDAAFIVELLNTPAWLQFIGDRNVKTKEQAITYLENGPIKSYKENGFGLWKVELKENKTPIGMCGILKRENLEDPDIGFAFLPQYFGKGYGFEVASATLSYGREKLGIEKILAITIPGNEKSIRLLEKIGLSFKENISATAEGEQLLLYST